MSPELLAALTLGGSAFVVGLSGAMAPGSFLTVVISRTLTRGPGSAALMLVGHAALEGLLLVGFTVGLQNILTDPRVSSSIAVIGGAILLWLGWRLIRDTTRKNTHEAPEELPLESPAGPMLQGMTVSLSNPYWTLWWATIGVKLAADGLAIGPVGVAAFFIGHQLADITWYGLVIAATARGRRALSGTTYRVILGACGVFMLYLGARFMLDGFGLL